MLLGPGEVLERRPKRLGRDHAEINLHAPGPPDARLRLSPEQHIRRFGPGDESFHHCLREVALDENVEVTDCLAAPPQAAGCLDPTGLRAGSKPGDELARNPIGLVPEQSRPVGIAGEG